MFWEVVASFTPAQRAALLRFVTSSSRPPLGGFRHLHPPFTVQRVDAAPRNPLAGVMGGRGDVELLPTASTCFCMLKLPQYAARRTLREKLLYSINSGAGFELS
jgi:ubiquitin-protein ligase E3 C